MTRQRVVSIEEDLRRIADGSALFMGGIDLSKKCLDIIDSMLERSESGAASAL